MAASPDHRLRRPEPFPHPAEGRDDRPRPGACRLRRGPRPLCLNVLPAAALAVAVAAAIAVMGSRARPATPRGDTAIGVFQRRAWPSGSCWPPRRKLNVNHGLSLRGHPGPSSRPRSLAARPGRGHPPWFVRLNYAKLLYMTFDPEVGAARPASRRFGRSTRPHGPHRRQPSSDEITGIVLVAAPYRHPRGRRASGRRELPIRRTGLDRRGRGLGAGGLAPLAASTSGVGRDRHRLFPGLGRLLAREKRPAVLARNPGSRLRNKPSARIKTADGPSR